MNLDLKHGFRIGCWTVEPLRGAITGPEGGKHHLQPKVMDVLVYLASRPCDTVSRDELLDAVWGSCTAAEESLTRVIAELRHALDDHVRYPEYIETIPKRGYRFLVSPTPLEAPFSSKAAAANDRTSILVAPIRDQSVDGDSAHIADGLTEEIIVELSRIRSFRVISPASALRLKGTAEALQDTARELGVDLILDGAVHRTGDRLRVTLQLRQLDSDDAQWSGRFDGTLENLFVMHDEIAQAIAEELAQKTSPPKPVDKESLEDPRAVESYLRARYEMWRFSQRGLQQAERHLLNGLNLVGPNIRLLAALGHVYARCSEIGLDPDGALLAKAADCANSIFELDANSSRGFSLLGIIKFHSGELRAAREPLERSLAANPSDPDTLSLLGYLYALIGCDEQALKLFAEALAIDPLTPINHCMPGFVALMKGRKSDALPYYRKFFKMDPYNAFAAWCLGYVLLRNDRIDDASKVIGELRAKHPDSILAQLGHALYSGVCGNREATHNAISSELRAAARNSELLSRETTHVLALAGETDEALDWLENTVRIGNINYPFWAQHNEWVNSLRATSRFESIMRDVELEWRSRIPTND